MAEDNRKEVKDLSHFQYLYGGAIVYFSLSFSGPFCVPLVCTFGGCAISRRIILAVAHPRVVEDKENIQPSVASSGFIISKVLRAHISARYCRSVMMCRLFIPSFFGWLRYGSAVVSHLYSSVSFYFFKFQAHI